MENASFWAAVAGICSVLLTFGGLGWTYAGIWRSRIKTAQNFSAQTVKALQDNNETINRVLDLVEYTLHNDIQALAVAVAEARKVLDQVRDRV